MSFESFPQIPNLNEQDHVAVEDIKNVFAIFTQLKGTEPIEAIQIPATVETAQEYIRKLEIMKKGTIMPIQPEETEHVIQRIDDYIEKLRQIK